MSLKWVSVPIFLFLSIAPSLCAKTSFENTAIVRTVELGGSIVHVTTTYAVRALENNQKTYTIALGQAEREKSSWLEAKVKGQEGALQYTERVEKCVTSCPPLAFH